MVICKFYLTNSCSFGTQCRNEHINVATVVKADAEAALKGKQWMLSSYGPFKDKASLPNFEDQSFEEIRWLCYEAKNNGNLAALLPQLNQKTVDASYRLAMLCDQNNVNNNLSNMLVNLYNSGEPVGNTQNSHSSGNPFAISGGVSGQTASLFGSSTTPQPNPFGSSLFGSSAAPSSSSQTNSIFGGGGNTTPSNFYGQQSSFGASGGSVFGGQSTFGGGSANNSFGASSFGQPSASPFSLSQIGQAADASKPQSSIFGTSQFQQTQNSIFGAAPAFGSQIQPTKPSGLFSSPATNSIFGQSATTPGLFGQASTPVNQPANTGNLFSSFATPAQPQPQTIFGAASVENKPMFGQTPNTNQSIFGTNQQQSSNIFANVLTQNSSANVFGVQHQPDQQQNVFNQPNSNTAIGTNVFQNQTNTLPVSGSSFRGNTSFGQPPDQDNQSAYSKLEDLVPEDLEWFTSETFALGRIPTVPPPRHLCV